MARQQQRGGQALVLVTLALVAMAGMMGLAVDLGWSFFVKAQAQTAADAGALAAIQEAFARGSTSKSDASFTCDGATVFCSPTPTDCASLGASSHSNLADACLYAVRNGFSSATSRQKVTVQADNGSNSLPTSPTGAPLGISNITYWVSVRAVQSVPQLFSAVLGNKNGLVASLATAAILNNSVPGSIVLLNTATDCSPSAATGTCGLDLYLAGEQHISTPGGIYMASTCNTRNGGAVCDNQGGDYAGWIVCDGSPTDNAVVAKTIVVQIPGMVSPYIAGHFGSGSSAGSVTNCSQAQPSAFNDQNGGWCIPTSSSSSGSGPAGGSTICNTTAAPVALGTASYFQDPTQGLAQPPLVSNAPTCGILNGLLSGSGTTLGPFAYYAYSATAVVAGQTVAIPSGNPVVVTGTVTFSSSSTTSCPGLSSGTAAASSFATTYFYGGLQLGTNSTAATVSFGPGQYVMVGANTTSINQAPGGGTGTCSPCAGSVWSVTKATVTGDSTAGTMFIFTAPAIYGVSSYPGLTAEDSLFGTGKAAALPNNATQFQYGNVNLGTLPGVSASGSVAGPGSGSGAADITLTGLNTNGVVPSTLDPYNGVVFWQDRGNSTVNYNANGTISGTAKSPLPPTGAEALVFGTDIFLSGILYQPRGGWIANPPNSSSGGTSSFCTTYTGCVTGEGENTDDLFQSEPRCGEIQGPLQIISGAMFNTCAGIDLTAGGTAVQNFKIALIQ